MLCKANTLKGYTLDSRNGTIGVNLTKQQLEDSPPLGSDNRVSRQFENACYEFYDGPTYWSGPCVWGGFPNKARDPHSRSTEAVTGPHLQAADGEIGQVEDFIIDDGNWTIRHLIHLVLRKDRNSSANSMEASESGIPASAVPNGGTRVQVEKPRLDVKDYLWMGTKGAFGFAAQLSMVIFLAYFIIASGDKFRRKIVKIAGPTLSKNKITPQVLDEITGQLRRFLLVQIFTSMLVGMVTWLAFLWIGLEHAASWGIAAGVCNTIPYFGPILISGGTALVAFYQFGTINMALLVAGLSLLITSLAGYLLTPWITGRASRMNSLVVLVSVLLWGWLWGVWGLLLGLPIIMIIKTVCERTEDLKAAGELLGE